eukprot:CAMPEP_0170593748 /NCGR_PEP_ID=MMETSP0224-20130122/13625_1 /TAXON_ID=285029 /ORGANISM="Togula jolla, Strain CCCM 725" /LENGTH=70 /DNA_ID=CAMNT_0010917745 /DNA_START=40 /DNA_END=248 /DNA_ORIENTATION=-
MVAYLSDKEKSRVEKMDMTMSLSVALGAVAREGESLLFKTSSDLLRWDPSFEVMASFFRDSGIKGALVFR